MDMGYDRIGGSEQGLLPLDGPYTERPQGGRPMSRRITLSYPLGQDIVGRPFGRWTVLAAPSRRLKARDRVDCRCACGAVRAVRVRLLLIGDSSSCGCYRRDVATRLGKSTRKHGRYGTKEHLAWKGMINRCYNTKNIGYEGYGGRGIRVCPEWLDRETGLQSFVRDMGEAPSVAHSIDRIDNSGDYEPGNCRWATLQEQSRNRRSNTTITHGGETLTLTEWAERAGMKSGTLSARIFSRGWPFEKAISTPVAAKHRKRGRACEGFPDFGGTHERREEAV